MSVLALIPARSGSKGIPGKNLRRLGGKTLIQHAEDCAVAARVDHLVHTSDYEYAYGQGTIATADHTVTEWTALRRPAKLAQDDTPMIAVVQHALSQIPGPPDQIIVLLQPTQPFRKPEHIQQAIALLRESGADSVVSVVELPRTHNAMMQLQIDKPAWSDEGSLTPTTDVEDYACGHGWSALPTRRQDEPPRYIRDGTVYVFWRQTIERGNIYGDDVRPLIIAPEDSCELDTESDWLEVERRWKARHGA